MVCGVSDLLRELDINLLAVLSCFVRGGDRMIDGIPIFDICVAVALFLGGRPRESDTDVAVRGFLDAVGEGIDGGIFILIIPSDLGFRT
jgi:hypothetical protein